MDRVLCKQTVTHTMTRVLRMRRADSIDTSEYVEVDVTVLLSDQSTDGGVYLMGHRTSLRNDRNSPVTESDPLFVDHLRSM